VPKIRLPTAPVAMAPGPVSIPIATPNAPPILTSAIALPHPPICLIDSAAIGLILLRVLFCGHLKKPFYVTFFSQKKVTSKQISRYRICIYFL